MATTFTNLLYHIVFSTKERRPMITEPIRSELYPYLGGIVREKDGILLEIGGTVDHVHIFAKLKQHIAIADILRELKANSSKLLNERPDLGQWYGWQTGYGAFTVSASQVSRVRNYIRNQEEHHRKRSFQEEFVNLLDKHGIEYEERYLWD